MMPSRKLSFARILLVFWPILVPVVFGIYLFTAARSDLVAQLDRLAQAESDNTTWNITQLEVDYLNLMTAVDRVVHVPLASETLGSTVDDAALRYDILLSRVGMLRTSDPTAQFVNNAEALQALEEVYDSLISLEEVFLLEGAAFLEVAPELSESLVGDRPKVRSLVLTTLESFVARAADQRVQLRNLLVSVVGVGVAALVVLTSISSALVVANSSTRRRAAAQKRLTSNLATTIEASPFGMMTADRNGVIRQFNSAAEGMFRLPKAEVLGRKLGELGFFSSSQHNNLLTAESVFLHAAKRSVIRHRVTCRRSNGETFASETVFAYDDDAEQLPVVIVCVRDISEQQTREAALAKAVTRARESEKAKTRFLAVMSHEMRSPLSSAIAAIELLEATDGFDETQKQYLEIVRNGADAALEQVDDVLELAYLDGGSKKEDPVVISLREYLAALENNYRPLANKQNNTLEIESPGLETPRILVRRRLLSRVVTNLLGNALKFTENGRVAVRCALKAEDTGQATLTLEIADTGPGIPADKLDSIFQDFSVLDPHEPRSGTGLGLGIARRAVQSLDGSVDVTSVPSRGTTFHLSIPVQLADPEDDRNSLHESPAALSSNCSDPADITTSQKSVLIVDDVEANRTVLREMVLRLGHLPYIANNGEEAIRLSLARSPDLILMDCSMPGMSGVEAAREIRRRMGGRAPRVVGLTANIMQGHQEKEANLDFETLEWKPIRMPRLKQLIENPPEAAVHRSRPTREPGLEDMYEARELIGAEQFDVLASSLAAEVDSLLLELSSPTPPSTAFVHRAAGACASLGVRPIHALFCEIEDSMRAGRSKKDLSAVVFRLRSEWKRLRPIILNQSD